MRKRTRRYGDEQNWFAVPLGLVEAGVEIWDGLIPGYIQCCNKQFEQPTG